MVVQSWTEVVTASLQTLWSGFIGFLPSLLGAVIIFIIGWLIAIVLGKLVAQIIRVLRIDQILEKMGHRVMKAKSGQEGIEIYEKHKDLIELVILDMIMPGVGGGETYDRIREINPAVKVLLSTGYSINGQATEILERGCNGFIQKPFKMKELSHKIREVLDKS